MLSFLSGLMADTFGNYFVAFIVAGGVGVVGSLLPFILLCLKREAGRDEQNTQEDAWKGFMLTYPIQSCASYSNW